MMNPFHKTRGLSLFIALCAALSHFHASAAILPESRTTQIRNAAPGDTYQEVIGIRNTGLTAVDVKIYQTDYSFSADGLNDYGKPGSLPRSNAKWLHLGQGQVTVPPGGVANVRYEVSVPRDTDLSGTYWSLLMIEPVSGQEAAGARKGEVSVTQAVRYAVQVVSEIGSSGKVELAFRKPGVLARDGKHLFSIDLENTGEQWLRPQLTLELFDSEGRLSRKLVQQQQRIYPATSVRYRFDLHDVHPGRYRALIVADSTGDDLFGTQVELIVP
ncbi:MAG: hypothetical protein JWO70_5321 [Betaproteobacteria bacterium]|nr:hypothetical protein [Betaproteobacteria bacterium]